MRKVAHHPGKISALGHKLSWKGVLAVIGGFSAIYVGIVASGNSSAIAVSPPSYFCPAGNAKEARKNMDEGCADGTCSERCPGNCEKTGA